MPFSGRVAVTPLESAKWKRWELLEDLGYQGKTDSVTVPKGFVTDFASVPRLLVWLLPRYGQWTQAAVLHDYLWSKCRRGDFDWFDADGMFNRAMREVGVPYLRRWIMWAAVRWAAPPRTWLARGVLPLMKMIVISLPALALVIVPATLVLLALIVGFLCEAIAYFPLRQIRRRKDKAVNGPNIVDVLKAG